ncbi:MCE family protein [Nocardia otitidiscaviarum]|uniref:MlaD family protein n=1 Tax=Nocardia otitidiscaviarum TaxID=1823 RepID=UPI0004A71D8C|nr:MlaD family protein [Nocardia otitidiscaviarum]MBF6132337.1 MCE family protein [Nocardia otitidiscaviarum]MBF6483429.1 MCE family protein [Nocardia otitidiscaviarum]
MTARSALSVTAILAVFVVGSAYLAIGVVRVDWFRQYLHVTMSVPESGGLQPHSPVLLSGVPVGEVTAVEVAGRGVLVRLRLEDTHPVPAASTVRIEALSALGEPYLQFTPTEVGGPVLADGAEIDTRLVRTPLSLPGMAEAATDLLTQLDPGAIDDLVSTFTAGLDGAGSVLPQVNRSAELLAATLLSRQPQLRGLLTDLQTIGADLDWLGPSLRAGGPEFGRFGGKVREVVDALDVLVHSEGFPDAYRTGTGLAPFLDQLTDRLGLLGPELAPLVPVLAPLTQATTGVLGALDIGALLTQALAQTGDQSVRLQISVR